MPLLVSDLSHVAAFTAPAIAVVGGARWIARGLWQRFEAKLNENREKIGATLEGQTQQMNRIETQTTRTNGRVASLEGRTTRIEGWIDGHKDRKGE